MKKNHFYFSVDCVYRYPKDKTTLAVPTTGGCVGKTGLRTNSPSEKCRGDSGHGASGAVRGAKIALPDQSHSGKSSSCKLS